MWAENYYIPYFLAVYVAGEIVCLTATFVWEGPANQCKKVLQRDVLCAFLLYVLSLACLVAVAFMVPKRSSAPPPLRPCPQVPQDSDWVHNKSYEVRRCTGVCLVSSFLSPGAGHRGAGAPEDSFCMVCLTALHVV